MKSCLAILLTFVSISFACSQEVETFDSRLNGKTVSFKELVTELLTAERNIQISNIKLRWKESEDRAFIDGRFLSKNEPEFWTVAPIIKFQDCEFDPDYWLLLRNIRFLNFTSFFHCTNIKIQFQGCSFDRSFRVVSNDIEFMKFNNCSFLKGFKLQRSRVTDQINFQDCKFTVIKEKPGEIPGLNLENRIFIVENRVESLNLTVEHCEFTTPAEILTDPKYFVILSNSNFDNLRFNNNIVNSAVDFTSSTVANLFMSQNCQFNSKIIVNALNLNSINTKIQWSSIANGRLGVLTESRELISAKESNSLKDENTSSELISCYANLYSAFRAQGNRLAANSCYMEWKDIETDYLRNTYKTSPSPVPFFSYLMNVFLKAFCDYGTNPFKSIIISLYVILAFALVYYFVADHHGQGTDDIFGTLKLVAENYRTPDILVRKRYRQLIDRQHRSSYDSYVVAMREKKKFVPRFFRSFAASFITKTRLRARLELTLLSMINAIPKNLFSFKPIKKAAWLFVYNLVISIWILKLIVGRTISSVILSLNVFSTLGFGDLPESKLNRYLTVIEGFIGWFLLSIFSVSLISQVIQ